MNERGTNPLDAPDAYHLETASGLAPCAAGRLRSLADRLAVRRPAAFYRTSFDLAWLADGALLLELACEVRANSPRGTPAIYRFGATSADYWDLETAFGLRPSEHERTGKALRYSRANRPQVPRALYVGSGFDLPQRISEHLGRTGAAGTYAMRVNLWALDVPGGIELQYWTYPDDMDPIELEVLEQELWDRETPLLGKRSGR